jgi:hypothetical protein
MNTDSIPAEVIEEGISFEEEDIIILQPDTEGTTAIAVGDWEWIRLVPVRNQSESMVRAGIQPGSTQRYVVTCVREMPNVRPLAFNESINSAESGYNQVPHRDLVWCSTPLVWDEISILVLNNRDRGAGDYIFEAPYHLDRMRFALLRFDDDSSLAWRFPMVQSEMPVQEMFEAQDRSHGYIE